MIVLLASRARGPRAGLGREPSLRCREPARPDACSIDFTRRAIKVPTARPLSRYSIGAFWTAGCECYKGAKRREGQRPDLLRPCGGKERIMLAPSKRQMHLGVFWIGAGNHSAGWRYDGAWATNSSWPVVSAGVQIAERGKFDLFFISDSLAMDPGDHPSFI